MSNKSRIADVNFWVALLIIFATIFLMISVSFRWLELHFTLDLLIGSYNIHHWFSWIGTLFVATFVPLYVFLKRRYVKKIKSLLIIHVFGNLFSIMLVSIHFTQQVTRPPQFFPHLGTGIVLYPTMVLLLLTGFFIRSYFQK